MDLDKYFVKSELIPAIIQEKSTGEVLMLAYMNRESMQKTFETGYTWLVKKPSGALEQGCNIRSFTKGN